MTKQMSTSILEVATMSSLEIAELTGKSHKHILTDIRKMLGQLNILVDDFSATRIVRGKSETYYNLPRRECDILVSGYSIKYRAAIIDRWQELESQKNPKVPTNFLEAMQLATKTLEQNEILKLERDKAIKTKAEIGSKREATAMATASKAVRKVKKLEVELDQSKQYCTIKRMEMIHHGQKFNWRLLKKTYIELGLEPIDVYDANYGTVKAYHKDVWMKAYALNIQ